MGLFNKATPAPAEEPKDNTQEELQKIKEKVMKNKIDKSEQLGYEKPKKTDFPENSDNLPDNATSDMKLIRILNEIENLKQKIDEVSRKDVAEIKNILENLDHMNDIIKEIPKETLAEMKNIKKNMPDTYQGIAENTAKHLHASVLGAIDSNILKLIKDSGKINSRDLLEKIEAKKVCSKNTLYSHITRLEEDGMLIRKRELHEVYYMVADSVKDSLNKQETSQETKPEPKPEPKKEAPAPKEEKPKPEPAKEEPKAEKPKKAPKKEEEPKQEEAKPAAVPVEEPAPEAEPAKEEPLPA